MIGRGSLLDECFSKDTREGIVQPYLSLLFFVDLLCGVVTPNVVMKEARLIYLHGTSYDVIGSAILDFIIFLESHEITSLRTQTYFRLSLVSAVTNVCELEPENDFRDVKILSQSQLGSQNPRTATRVACESIARSRGK